MSVRVLSKSNKGVQRYEISNKNGMIVEVITLGGRISRLIVPSKIGDIDVVAGYDDVDGFFHDEGTYFNAIIGRVANRIGGGKFRLNGKEYNLYKNDGNNTLHGGKEGFDIKIWNAQIVSDNSVRFSYISSDGEEGFPGNLAVSVLYTLDDDNALNIEYRATTDKDTPCSLTNHAYFNLDGDFNTVLNHDVKILASHITSVDDELIPDGTLIDVKGTPFDFNDEKKIGRDINDSNPLLIGARGYDHNYVLINDLKNAVATAYSHTSGVKMSVYTDRPCMQLYTGNFLNGIKGKRVYNYQSAFCMETQGYPNALNVDSFDSAILKMGEKYYTHTAYKFEW